MSYKINLKVKPDAARKNIEKTSTTISDFSKSINKCITSLSLLNNYFYGKKESDISKNYVELYDNLKMTYDKISIIYELLLILEQGVNEAEKMADDMYNREKEYYLLNVGTKAAMYKKNNNYYIRQKDITFTKGLLEDTEGFKYSEQRNKSNIHERVQQGRENASAIYGSNSGKFGTKGSSSGDVYGYNSYDKVDDALRKKYPKLDEMPTSDYEKMIGEKYDEYVKKYPKPTEQMPQVDYDQYIKEKIESDMPVNKIDEPKIETSLVDKYDVQTGIDTSRIYDNKYSAADPNQKPIDENRIYKECFDIENNDIRYEADLSSGTTLIYRNNIPIGYTDQILFDNKSLEGLNTEQQIEKIKKSFKQGSLSDEEYNKFVDNLVEDYQNERFQTGSKEEEMPAPSEDPLDVKMEESFEE